MLPMKILLLWRLALLLRDHAWKRVRAADDVYVQMIHVLPADPTRVDDGPEALRAALLARETPRTDEHAPEDSAVPLLDHRERFDVLLGDDYEVHGGRRIDVVEGEHLIVLVDLAARDLASDDLAEDAVGHCGFPWLRAAFSSRPERPSRRSSSARTSASGTACHASITMQWNHRSAVSWTIEARSPPLEAITVSTASSATFLRMWSSPRAFSAAT